MHSGTVLRSCNRIRQVNQRTDALRHVLYALLRQAEARAAARGDEIGQEAQAEAERLRREAEKRLDMAADLIVGRVVKD